MTSSHIRLLLADVDGTLVTEDKVLTGRAIAAVRKLDEAGIVFAITSGRPPRGMAMLIEPLRLTSPIAAFNGGLFARPDLSVISQKEIPADVVGPVIAMLSGSGLDVWLYRGADWLIRDPKAPHVDREAWTVQFPPTVVKTFEGMTSGLAKIVGISDDHDLVERIETAAQRQFGQHVSARRSQPYYLDVTNPKANKGAVADFLCEHYGIENDAVATIGDGPNDVVMFKKSGLSIAMGNASEEVRQAADRVTASYEDEGFAKAVEEFILGSSGVGPRE
jgi:Cof subfamily protein (haloacid dehalogenase superfamily)